MKKIELIERISNGEDSYTQFKEQIIHSKELAKEFVAFSNAEGGIIIFGVSDDGDIKGLNITDVEKIGQLVGNVGQENVKPPIHPLIQNITIDEKKLMVVFIKSGLSKPYKTSSGVFYTKSSSDKKIISDEELKRLFAESKRLYADEEAVNKTDITDLNQQRFNLFLEKFDKNLYDGVKNNNLNLITLLQNFDIMKGNNLTLAGNLIFGMNPQKFNKSFYIDCCYFDGNDISVTKYISERRAYGDFESLYEKGTDFIKSNLKNRQVGENFNSNGVPEISYEVIGELVTNALIHRDYYINSPIRIYIFHNRVEIISPGKLYNSLTVEKIKCGTTIRRNQTLDRICNNVLSYTGRGSGIRRVLNINPDIEFVNDTELEQFKCIIHRKERDRLVDRLGDRLENLTKNRQEILKAIDNDSLTTIAKLAEMLGISTTAIENNIKYLKENGLLKRVGSDNSGSWEITDEI
ncbi:putative DNA binding domain-containing protein [bacterium]|nr:putative DNA binding domain-containing protein [bacterium]